MEEAQGDTKAFKLLGALDVASSESKIRGAMHQFTRLTIDSAKVG